MSTFIPTIAVCVHASDEKGTSFGTGSATRKKTAMESSCGTPERILAHIASISIAIDGRSLSTAGPDGSVTDDELVPLLRRLQTGIINLQSNSGARALAPGVREAFVNLYHPLFFGAACCECTAARVTYLACLQTLVKMNPTAFHADWPKLLGGDVPSVARHDLPSAHSASDTAPIGCGLHMHLRDETPKLRHAVAASISTLIEGPAQRAYLGMAAHLGGPAERVKSFISLSEVLGRSVVANVEALRVAVALEEDEAACAAMVRAMTTFLVGSWGEKGKRVGSRRMPGDVARRCVAALVQKVDDRGGAPRHRCSAGPAAVELGSGALSSACGSSAKSSASMRMEVVAVCLGSLASIFGAGGVPRDGQDVESDKEFKERDEQCVRLDVETTLDVLVRCLTQERSTRIKLEAAAALRGVLRWMGMQDQVTEGDARLERLKSSACTELSQNQRQAERERQLTPLFVETKAALGRASGTCVSPRQKESSNKERLMQQLVLLFGDLGIADWELVNGAANHRSARIRAAAFSCFCGAHTPVQDANRDLYMNLSEMHATEQHESESTVRSSAVKAYLEALTRETREVVADGGRPSADVAARILRDRECRVLNIVSLSLRDSVLAVRVNAAILVAEVASALWHSCMEHFADTWGGAYERQRGAYILCGLLKSVITACGDHEKVAVHSIRALGFLTGGVLRLEGTSTRSLSDLSDDIVSVLVDGMYRGTRGKKELQWSCSEAIAVACMLRPNEGGSDGDALCARLSTIVDEHNF